MAIRQIVRKAPADQAAPGMSSSLQADDIEPSLLPPSRRLVRQFPVAGLSDKYLVHLEQRIERNPRDLRSHVERVLTHLAQGDADAVHGSLIDLYQTLGRQGLALRKRLLEDASELLSAEQTDFFHKHLETGLDASDISASVSRSRLSKQVHGATGIVARKTDSETTADVVSLARESIANGQIEAAKLLLEGALDADPGHEAACRELLELYEREDLCAAFRETRTALIGRSVARPDLWEKLAQRFAPGSDHAE